jgi:hypothetical protein
MQFEPEFNEDHTEDHVGFEDITRLVFPDIDRFHEQLQQLRHEPGPAA